MASSYVSLNVGGKIYQTSRTTLTQDPDSFFALMLSDRIPSATNDRGNYLIDRDGELFRHILNYMRYQELVLPEGFCELSLLEREADFFQLGSLKLEIQRMKEPMPDASKLIGLNVGGKIYKTTRETLLREPDSFFAAMLSGAGPSTQKDAQGNYEIDRNGDKFGRILEYLRIGFILPFDLRPHFDHLKNEADFFNLQILKEHIKSVTRLYNYIDRGKHVDLHYLDRFCVVYTNRNDIIGRNLCLPLTPEDFFTTIGGVKVVSFTLDEKKGGTPTTERLSGSIVYYPSSKEDLRQYISFRTQVFCPKQIKLPGGYTKFIFQGDR